MVIMSDMWAEAAEAAMAAFLAALDLGDRAAAAALMLPDARFGREVQGMLLDLDRDAWLALVHGRDPAGAGARNALLMDLTAEAAAFKVDTRLERDTLTDYVRFRHGPGGWRVASILSCQ